jgi:phosphatidylserine decarboxylase
MFTKYGYTTLGIITVLVFIVISLSFFLNNNYFKIILICIAVFFLVFSLNFFRDPERTPPNRDDVVVAPADGKILIIKDVENKFFNGKARQVSIFMSPLNVHVNRIPIDGSVKHVRYIEGKFIAAFEDKADQENERSEFLIENRHGNVFFTQVAGFVARRIIYDLKEGDKVKMGNRFGMIKFGSRVDVVVPADWIIKVQKDDIVTAGETILFEIPGK